MSRKLILAVILLSMAAYPLYNSYATQVSGDCWGTWTSDMNPIEVVGNLRVPPNSTLIIQPGCRIIFQGHYSFIVDSLAALQAIGSSSDSILFTAANHNTGWLGLKFLFAGSGCQLSYCIFEWGRTNDHNVPYNSNGAGVFGYNSNISISHCSFKYNFAYEGQGGAIYCAYCTLSVVNSNLSFNKSSFGGAALYCGGSDAIIEYNMFYADSTWYPLGGEFGGAISCENSNITINHNKIINNFSGTFGGGALILGCGSIITNNIIDNNRSYDNGGGAGREFDRAF